MISAVVILVTTLHIQYCTSFDSALEISVAGCTEWLQITATRLKTSTPGRLTYEGEGRRHVALTNLHNARAVLAARRDDRKLSER